MMPEYNTKSKSKEKFLVSLRIFFFLNKKKDSFNEWKALEHDFNEF